MPFRVVRWGVMLGLLLAGAGAAGAQPLGTFRWQLSPFCNVLSLQVTQIGSQYRLEGFDDQCGAGPRAAATGLVVPNTDGSLEFGITIVTASAAVPAHVDVTFNVATLGGSWRDSAGNNGTFVFNPPAPAAGSPRPVPAPLIAAGSIGAAQINSAEVQRRVAGTCPAGQFMQTIGADGVVACGTGGDITGVSTGNGLSGGGPSGEVSLAVAFGGPGTAITVARSDHTHAATGSSNTAIGLNAMPVVTTGNSNTAVGSGALKVNTTGSVNVAVGSLALFSNTNGSGNTALGNGALESNVGGIASVAIGNGALLQANANYNVSIGYQSMFADLAGDGNVAIGAEALDGATGSNNIAIGYQAGTSLLAGSHNLYLANSGAAADAMTTRIGTIQTRAFMAGVRGVTTANNNAVAVVVDSAGQLGTVSSSRRYKDDIQDLGDVALRIQRLRPVQFRYTAPFGDGSRPLQYGLIAEEVAAVDPELVALNQDGRPESVKYHVLPSLLVAEVQRLERERADMRAALDALRTEVAALDALRTEVAQLRAALEASAAARPR